MNLSDDLAYDDDLFPEEQTTRYFYLVEDAAAKSIKLAKLGSYTEAGAWREVAIKQNRVKPRGVYRILSPKNG